VFAGTDTRNGKLVAIKMLPQEDETFPVEVEILKRLKSKTGFARLHWHGDTPDGGNSALVTDLLGTSLGDLMEKRGRSMEVAPALHIGLQLLLSVEQLHEEGFLHRDIKPDNCMFGRGTDCGRVFLIDFGLSKSFVDEEKHRHVEFADQQSFSGTPDFASLRSHTGVRQARRDDLESFCYVLIHMLRGNLPWMGLNAESEEELMEMVVREKMQTSMESLCAGCPSEVLECLKYARSLSYDTAPDYAKLRSLLTAALKRAGGDIQSSLRIKGMCPPPVLVSRM